LNLMAEITMAKQLLASEPCRLPACLFVNYTWRQQCNERITFANAVRDRYVWSFPTATHASRHRRSLTFFCLETSL